MRRDTRAGLPLWCENSPNRRRGARLVSDGVELTTALPAIPLRRQVHRAALLAPQRPRDFLVACSGRVGDNRRGGGVGGPLRRRHGGAGGIARNPGPELGAPGAGGAPGPPPAAPRVRVC